MGSIDGVVLDDRLVSREISMAPRLDNDVGESSQSSSEKLGTINVLGMSRTASQDRAVAAKIAAAATTTDTTSQASTLTPFTPRNITYELKSSPESEFTNLATPSIGSNEQSKNGNRSGIHQSALARPSSTSLSHKDSFGHHAYAKNLSESSNVLPLTPQVASSSGEEIEAMRKEMERTQVSRSTENLWSNHSQGSSSPIPHIDRLEARDSTSSALRSQSTDRAELQSSSTFQDISSRSSDNRDPKEELPAKRSGEEGEEEEEDGATKQEVKRGQPTTPRKSPARQTAASKPKQKNDSTASELTTEPMQEAATNTESSSVPSVSNIANIANGKASRFTPIRAGPQLPSAPNVGVAPPPAMYWSKVPVHGSIPRRSFRAHSANLADEILWLFGGCDTKGCFREVWCFDTETMCWSKPKVTGDLPPPRRAHSATMVDKRLYVFAGGDGPYYFNDLYIFDTISLRWTKPDVDGTPPSPRRAHTSNYYNGQLIIFGGGNGVGALNDVFILDIKDTNRPEWKRMECKGNIPIGRGYHTSNLVDGKLIVIGGSDGHMSFNDIHVLRLDTRIWYQIKTDEIHNRLGHTATQVGSYLFIVGGHDSISYTPEILTLNLVNLQWEPRKVCGQKPPGRGYHQAWLRDSRLFVHGGFDGKEIYDDLYFIDLAACAYLPQITSFSVEVRWEPRFCAILLCSHFFFCLITSLTMNSNFSFLFCVKRINSVYIDRIVLRKIDLKN